MARNLVFPACAGGAQKAPIPKVRMRRLLLLLLLLLLLHIVEALPEPSPQRPRALRSGKTNQPVVSPTSQSPPRILTQQKIVTSTGDSEASDKSP